MHTISLTKSGKLYAWGSNSFGQLALPKEFEYVNKPKNIHV